MSSSERAHIRNIVIASTLVAFNLIGGKLAAVLSLPVYLDTTGTIIGAAVLPLRWSLAVGASSALFAGIITNPGLACYAGTQMAIAATAFLCVKWGLFARLPTALFSGVLIGVVSSVISAPVTVLVFGGVLLPGTTFINALLIATGHSLWKSTIGGSLLVEIMDKPAAAAIAWLVLKRLPARLASRV